MSRVCCDCGGKIKNRSKNTKRCKDCYLKLRSSGAYKSIGLYICECGGKKSKVTIKCTTCNSRDAVRIMNCEKCGKIREYKKGQKLCKVCYDEKMNSLNRCIKCGAKRTTNKSTYCRQCYRGAITKRWNHNLTDEERASFRTKQPAYYEWRKNVFERDKYQCQKCGDNKGGNLCSHHIENFSENKELRFDINNGMTLCEKCHIEFHKKYGWKENDVIQLMEFIKPLLKYSA